jgi:DNA (cytosine-5)-methyltransferase 3A
MVALERAGIKVDRYVAYEIDKYAIKVSQKNYPQIEQMGDVTTADFSQYKDFDLLIGGSPCTYWSIAKSNRETTPNGVGGQLFMQYVRALKETNCKYFLYENNYSIHNNIKNFITEQLGVQPIMINSASVSAQQRKRCYWTNIPNVSQPDDKGILLKDIIDTNCKDVFLLNTTKGKSQTIKATSANVSIANIVRKDGFGATGIATPIRIGQYDKGGQGQRIYSILGKSITQSANSGGQGGTTGLYKIDLPDGDYIIRKLTPVEAERLQTLPDNYTAGISNTQRYKCIGNGWTVDVIVHILQELKREEK